eukprot:CAMPEP_0201487070 /NCGR_PEP_ID=MMETSP0151_2-20130828/11072_1 /ASSEMBLY_ACC=CAM_ASM_000257 /TAXON_ID=200890 /ORGANISM="Paramoeba atlantica, Strain 621/1 / CCAP 1560/9" /LENGTH=193 /DNA_ID=CAMNT_0047872001 /DNA_START=93 /DNA_END=674 /DNA_ORIENTATION=+
MGDSCSKEEIQDDTREEEKNRKIVIFGERKTGKTGLIERFVSGSFPPNYRTMIGVSLALKVLTVEETTKVHLQLWDLAGRCTESESRAFYSKRASAVIYLYSIDSRKSFDSIVAWCNSLSLDDEVQKVIVGSKSDLEEERVVSEDEGRGLANQLGMMFMEVSGKTGHNVDDLFFELASTLVQRKNPYIKKARC